MPVRSSYKGKIIFSDEEKAYIREAYRTECCNDIAERLGVSDQKIREYARENGFERSPEWSQGRFHGRYVRDYKHKRILKSQSVTPSSMNN